MHRDPAGASFGGAPGAETTIKLQFHISLEKLRARTSPESTRAVNTVPDSVHGRRANPGKNSLEASYWSCGAARLSIWPGDTALK